MNDKKVLDVKAIIEVNFNDENEIIYKLNKISTQLELPLNEIIEKAIDKLYYDIEFVRALRK